MTDDDDGDKDEILGLRIVVSDHSHAIFCESKYWTHPVPYVCETVARLSCDVSEYGRVPPEAVSGSLKSWNSFPLNRDSAQWPVVSPSFVLVSVYSPTDRAMQCIYAGLLVSIPSIYSLSYIHLNTFNNKYRNGYLLQQSR
jgi:hypothetical protein